jgi:hypothetical protein
VGRLTIFKRQDIQKGHESHVGCRALVARPVGLGCAIEPPGARKEVNIVVRAFPNNDIMGRLMAHAGDSVQKRLRLSQ